MRLYKYKEGTKEYIGYFEAYLDPLESLNKGEDIYVIPPCSTPIAPFIPSSHHTVIFNELEGKWEEVEDNRGIVVWDEYGSSFKITELGPIPEGFFKERIMPLKEIKEIKIRYNQRM